LYRNSGTRAQLDPGAAVSSGGTTPNLRETDGRLKLSVGHGGCGSEARRAQDGLDTHSLRKPNALRHTCQLKFQTGGIGWLL
jgi:hypothetical protein